jgi:tRNA U55 pseudouridine synthase TruB
VHRFEQLWRDGDRVGLELEVSSGTYVRQLVSDFGDAYCDELERVAVGSFRLEDAGSFVPLDEALSFLPGVELVGSAAEQAAHGVAVPGPAASGAVRLTHESRLIAIARPEGDTLKPFIVFPA